MKSLKELFQIISNVVPFPGVSENQAQLLSRLNPEKFYAENVRSILGVSHANAVRICETAVRQGVFERRVEVKCPDGAVAASADIEANLPEKVRCWAPDEGHLEAVEMPTRDLEKSTFYRLNDGSDASYYERTA